MVALALPDYRSAIGKLKKAPLYAPKGFGLSPSKLPEPVVVTSPSSIVLRTNSSSWASSGSLPLKSCSKRAPLGKQSYLSDNLGFGLCSSFGAGV
jgi:hypothetical protein